MASPRLCTVPACGKPRHGQGFCNRHYSKFRAHGDPLGGRRGSSPGEPLKWIKDHAAYEGDDCLIWPFERPHGGYGTVRHKGRRRVASRVMCEIVHGEPENPKADACHSCGNGHIGCMTPRHLRFGTRLDNIQDAKRHGTWMEGQRAKSKDMDDDKVRQIRALKGKMLQREVSTMFGISEVRVSKIMSRKSWGWVV